MAATVSFSQTSHSPLKSRFFIPQIGENKPDPGKINCLLTRQVHDLNEKSHTLPIKAGAYKALELRRAYVVGRANVRFFNAFKPLLYIYQIVNASGFQYTGSNHGAITTGAVHVSFLRVSIRT